jgi:hypothetical protein
MLCTKGRFNSHEDYQSPMTKTSQLQLWRLIWRLNWEFYR